MRTLLLLFLALLPPAWGRLAVMVSVAPQLEAVRRIGADLITVEPLIPPNMNPENYVIPPQRVTQLSQARVWFLIGMPVETALVRKIRDSLPDLRLVDTRQGMRILDVGQHEHHHSNGVDAHGHDPHVWLSLQNMMVHARTVGAVLAELLPAEAEAIGRRTDVYTAELNQLEAELGARMAPCRGSTILVVHPAFGYFLSAYGLVQVAVEENGKEPGGKYLAGLLRQISELRLRAVFTQPQFSGKTAQTLANRLALQIVVLDPLPDPYQDGMRQLAEDIRSHALPK